MSADEENDGAWSGVPVPRAAPESVKVIIEVSAGVIPGEPMAEYTRRWTITSTEFEQAQAQDSVADPAHAYALYLLMTGRHAQADEYARLLRNPDRVNWVRTEWVWM